MRECLWSVRNGLLVSIVILIIKSDNMLFLSHVGFDRLMAAATPPRTHSGLDVFLPYTVIRQHVLGNTSVPVFNRSAASPLRMADVPVPGICCPVFLSCVLLSQSLDTLVHSSVNSGLPAADSDMVQQNSRNDAASDEHYCIKSFEDAP